MLKMSGIFKNFFYNKTGLRDHHQESEQDQQLAKRKSGRGKIGHVQITTDIT